MKKRVHLNDLRIGMFVEDTEGNSSNKTTPKTFMISTWVDIDCLIKNNILSVVINTEKSAKFGGPIESEKAISLGAFQTELNSNFSAVEIADAKRTIGLIAPHVRQVLLDVRNGQDIAACRLNDAVDHVVSATLGNSDAFLTLLKLKRRDNGTFFHSVAVSALMIAFGRSLALEDGDVRQLGIAGLVHDLGKMRLPWFILQKKGRLTAAEVALIQTHPYEGSVLLKRLPDIQIVALDVTLCHHEKYDGSGYPRKLAGENIPYSARIAAICDVYDALTTVRPYKRAWSQAEAIDLMLRSRGHFDPALLEAFISGVVVTSRTYRGNGHGQNV